MGMGSLFFTIYQVDIAVAKDDSEFRLNYYTQVDPMAFFGSIYL